MGFWTEPAPEELFDLCRGRPRLYALLVFLSARTHARDGGYENAGRGSMVDEYRRLFGGSRSTVQRELRELEALEGVRVERTPNGVIAGVRTEAYARWNAQRLGRASPVTPSPENPMGGGRHGWSPTASQAMPKGVTGGALHRDLNPPPVPPLPDPECSSSCSGSPPPTPQGFADDALGVRLKDARGPRGTSAAPERAVSEPPARADAPDRPQAGLDGRASPPGTAPADGAQLAPGDVAGSDPDSDPAAWRKRRLGETLPEYLERAKRTRPPAIAS